MANDDVEDSTGYLKIDATHEYDKDLLLRQKSFKKGCEFMLDLDSV